MLNYKIYKNFFPYEGNNFIRISATNPGICSENIEIRDFVIPKNCAIFGFIISGLASLINYCVKKEIFLFYLYLFVFIKIG